jgi:hypothetical protein
MAAAYWGQPANAATGFRGELQPPCRDKVCTGPSRTRAAPATPSDRSASSKAQSPSSGRFAATRMESARRWCTRRTKGGMGPESRCYAKVVRRRTDSGHPAANIRFRGSKLRTPQSGFHADADREADVSVGQAALQHRHLDARHGPAGRKCRGARQEYDQSNQEGREKSRKNRATATSYATSHEVSDR